MRTHTITYYQCELCNSDYQDEKRAISCEKKCKKEKLLAEKQEEWSNSIRLAAATPDDIKRLLIEKTKEYLEVDLKINEWPQLTFDKLEPTCVSHESPIGKKQGYNEPFALAWRFETVGEYFKYKRRDNSHGLSDLVGWGSDLPLHFKAIHTGTGGSWHEGTWHYSTTIFVEDYPLILHNYNCWKLDTEFEKNWPELEKKFTF